jgi:hypothetical protein
VNYCDPEIKNNAWTAAEEALLLQLHQVNGSTWAQFTRDFDGHSEVDIRNRYNRLIHQKPKPIPSREDAAAPGGELHYIASEEALLADIRASGEGAFLHDVVDSDPWDFLLDPIFNPMAPRNNKAHDPWDPFSWDFP